MPGFDVVVPATHDTACAYATAAAADCQQAMILSTGTWFLAGMLVSEPCLGDAAFEAGLSNEVAADGSIRLLKAQAGTYAVQELCRQWTRQDGRECLWSGFERLAAAAEPGRSVLDLNAPLFNAPQDMEEAMIAYCRSTRQPAPRLRAEMARAVYESLAAMIARTARQLGQFRKEPFREILVLGGAAHSPLLMRWIADASGLPVRVGPAEATAAGNALIQARTLGWPTELLFAEAEVESLAGLRTVQPASDHDWSLTFNRLEELWTHREPSPTPVA